MRVHYCKLNQVALTIITFIPDVASLLEQINITPDGWYKAFLWPGIFFSVSNSKIDHLLPFKPQFTHHRIIEIVKETKYEFHRAFVGFRYIKYPAQCLAHIRCKIKFSHCFVLLLIYTHTMEFSAIITFHCVYLHTTYVY